MDALKEKISKSISFHSFLSESAVCEALRLLGWNAKHGAYYEDIETKKQREVDVIARQFWGRKSKNGDQFVRLTILVEVKTMKGFHLLVSPFEEDGFSFYQNVHWLGDPRGDYTDLASALRVNGMEEDALNNFLKRLHQFAYPRQIARPRLLMVRPNTETVFTSFRETNIGSEKELDNSVFWKASQSLRAASKSIQKSIIEGSLDDIAGSVKYAPKAKEKHINYVLGWAKDQINRIDVIHPIVVTDADIWASGGDGPEPVKWSRFGQYSFDGTAEWWCDVVNSNHFAEYAQVISEHYALELKAAKAKLQK
jgi:hypothetical protein